jgi:hypothetical protein
MQMADNGDPDLKCLALAAWVRRPVKDAVNRQHQIHPIRQPGLLTCKVHHLDGQEDPRRAGTGRHQADLRHQRRPPRVAPHHLRCPHSSAWRHRVRMHHSRPVTPTQTTSTHLQHQTRPIPSSPTYRPRTKLHFQNGTTYQQLTQPCRKFLQTLNPSLPCLLNSASSHQAAPALRRPSAPR